MSFQDAPANDTHPTVTPSQDGVRMIAEGRICLAFEERSAGVVRQLLDVLLRARGVGRAEAQNAVLVAHEVFVNALDHGRPDVDGRVEVTWELTAHELAVSVLDAGSGALVAVGPNSLDAPRGRGMAIVAGLSSDWSVDTSRGTRVTVRLPLHSGVS